METFTSELSNKEYPISEKVVGRTIRNPVFDLIRKENPQFSLDSVVSISELKAFREKHLEQLLAEQIGVLTPSEETVLESLKDNTALTRKLEPDEDQEGRTFGQRIADSVAQFGGSWTFIISFGLFLLIWISVNIFWLANKGFDPYPFILLNLILSTLAAIQAPVIMMSQNRQEAKDRDRAQKDYMINLKSELEIRILHEKIDHLVQNQQQEVLEMQKKQAGMINDILKRMTK